MTALSSALIASGEQGASVHQAIQMSPYLSLEAMCLLHSSTPSDYVSFGNARTYEDPRLLIMHESPEVLLLAIPASLSHDVAGLAAQRCLPTWQTAPPFGSAKQAQVIIHQFEAQSVPYFVSRFWESEPAYPDINRTTSLVGSVHHCSLEISYALGRSHLHHRLASDDALFPDALYSGIDLLVSCVGPVEQIYCACYHAAKHQCLSGHMAAVLKHERGTNTAMSCTPTDRRDTISLSVYGTSGKLIITDERVLQYNPTGDLQDESLLQCTHPHLQSINRFAQAIKAGDQLHNGQEHLKTMATVEAARLSARTNQLECPHQLLALQQLT